MFDIATLERQYARIGAELRHELHRPQPWEPALPGPYTLDIDDAGAAEAFVLRTAEQAAGLQLHVVNARPDLRHLLLHVAHCDGGAVDKRKFLCGHDERHWFVAEVASRATTVEQAMDALRPVPVELALRRRGVKAKRRHRRRTRAFVRQGEWFFVPEPGFAVRRTDAVLRREPLRRGTGKPHLVDEIVRSGGELVYVSPRHPQGLTEVQYRKRLQRQPALKRLRWQAMRRNPAVYARGAVRHADHATIHLDGWHRVVLNGERLSAAVAFID